MAARDYDHLFKLLIIGDSGVGKSSIMTRFADNVFDGTYIATIGVDFKIRTLQVDGKKIRLQIWDTAGQERFKTITTTFYRGAHGVIVVYDVTRLESFTSVRKWLTEIDHNCDIGVCKILVGNKTDREQESRMVSEGEGQSLARDVNVPFVETSAKSNTNIELLFTTISRLVVETQMAKLAAAASGTFRRIFAFNQQASRKGPANYKQKSCHGT